MDEEWSPESRPSSTPNYTVEGGLDHSGDHHHVPGVDTSSCGQVGSLLDSITAFIENGHGGPAQGAHMFVGKRRSVSEQELQQFSNSSMAIRAPMSPQDHGSSGPPYHGGEVPHLGIEHVPIIIDLKCEVEVGVVLW